jgi:DNA-binding transcriptional LysR family regulator
MELRQLRLFAAVAQYGSFNRAAEHLNLTQPALSRQVKKLEAELGVALLTRSDSGVILTAAGIIFLEEAREILAAADLAFRRVRKRAQEKPLRVGYLPAFLTGIMPSALARFKAEVATPSPELLDLTPQEIVFMANDDRLDIAVLPEELEGQVPYFQWATLRQLSAVLVMPKEHPLAKTKKISPTILADYPVHGLDPLTFPEYAPRLRAMLRPFDVKPTFEDQTADGVQPLFHSLEADMGLAVLVEGVANMLPNQLTIRSFEPALPPLRVSLGLADVPRNDQAQVFVKVLRDVANHARRRLAT